MAQEEDERSKMTKEEYQILTNKIKIKSMSKNFKNVEEAAIVGESPIKHLPEVPKHPAMSYVYSVGINADGVMEIGKKSEGFSPYEVLGFLQLELARITKEIMLTLVETPNV